MITPFPRKATSQKSKAHKIFFESVKFEKHSFLEQEKGYLWGNLFSKIFLENWQRIIYSPSLKMYYEILFLKLDWSGLIKNDFGNDVENHQ